MRAPEPEAVSPSSDEVVLAVSVSYPVDCVAAAATFGGTVPIVHLRSEEMLADRYWSLEKQQAIVVAFRDTVQRLMAQGVRRIHLVLAAPSSLCIRMGMAYDRRLMPELVVYQYERTVQPPYPWGIRMPTHGYRAAALERFTRSDTIQST
ncbi:SAVED domain-containing protein (plasmid) [Cupriavidus basilensis]